tara:strand:+ start:523 stop:1794 length:1272 start_codon:yes stop_codon:yes gene_type:complete
MKTDTKTKSSTRNRILASVTGVQTPNVTRENIDQKDLKSKWIPFFKGSKNVWINDLALRKRRSATHGAVIESKITYSIGKKLIFLDDNREPVELDGVQADYFEEVNSNDESLYEVYSKVQADYIEFGNAYIEVVKKDGRVSLFHRDATTVRIGVDGKKAYISAFWRDIGETINYPNRDYPITEIDLTGKKSNYLVHVKNYEPEYHTYGVPDYSGALKDADIEYKISTFNLDKLDNGFFPSVLLQMFGEPPDGKDPERYVKDLVDKYTGEGNARKVVAELLDDREQAANIHEFTTPQTGEFVELKQLVKEGIVEGHRWHSALMMQISGKLANSSDIRTAFEMVNNTVIPAYRKPILKVFKKLLKETPLDGYTLDIMPIRPVSSADRVNVSEVWTINELRQETGKDEIEGGDEFVKQDKKEENGV